jgi:hypothetical protein
MLRRIFLLLFGAFSTTFVGAQSSFTFSDAYQTVLAIGPNGGSAAAAIANYTNTTGTPWSAQYYEIQDCGWEGCPLISFDQSPLGQAIASGNDTEILAVASARRSNSSGSSSPSKRDAENANWYVTASISSFTCQGATYTWTDNEEWDFCVTYVQNGVYYYMGSVVASGGVDWNSAVIFTFRAVGGNPCGYQLTSVVVSASVCMSSQAFSGFTGWSMAPCPTC